MKKLLLTSTGLATPEIVAAFGSMLGKSANETKVLFVPTASRTEEEMVYVDKSRDELLQQGIVENNIFDLDTSNLPGEKIYDQVDLIYVCGGNTYYLMHELKQTGIDLKIKELVENGVPYISVSAGSIIPGPSISIASDENDIGLNDFSGLSLVDFMVKPHYTQERESIVREYEEQCGTEVKRIADTQAVRVVDNQITII